jgi:hypothetical protein
VSSPSPMAERRRGSTVAGHLRPGDDMGIGARAAGKQGEHDVRTEKGKRGSRGEESTERGSPVSSAGAPASDSHGGEAYHGKLRQARAARERGDARSKTETLAVS